MKSIKLLLIIFIYFAIFDKQIFCAELIQAIKTSDTAFIKRYIDTGNDINAIVSTSKMTPVEIAIKNGKHEIVKLLIESEKFNDRIINLRFYNYSKSSYFFATYFREWEILKLLILSNNNDYYHNNIINLIDYFSYKSEKVLIPNIIDCIESKINSVDNNGQNFVTLCLKRSDFLGLYRIIYKLIELKNFDPNIVDLDGRTAFIWALISRKFAIAMQLLKLKNIDPTIIDKNKMSALDYAILKNNIPISAVLLKRKDIHKMLLSENIKLLSNLPNLMVDPILKKLLIQKSTALCLQDQLFDAIKRNDLLYFKILIKSMSMHVYDKNGNNPMHYAIKYSRYEILSYLLLYVPNLLFIPNDNNETPIDFAIYNLKSFRLMLGLEKLEDIFDNNLKRQRKF